MIRIGFVSATITFAALAVPPHAQPSLPDILYFETLELPELTSGGFQISVFGRLCSAKTCDNSLVNSVNRRPIAYLSASKPVGCEFLLLSTFAMGIGGLRRMLRIVRCQTCAPPAASSLT